MNDIEQHWSANAWRASGEPGSHGPGTGPTPARLAEIAAELNAIPTLPAREMAVVPLHRLLAAHELALARLDRDRAGDDRLREIGLGKLSTEGHETVPPAMTEIVVARIRAERPPPPPWLGKGMAAEEVGQVFGELDDDQLADLGLARLDKRLAELETGMAVAEQRADFLRQFEPGGPAFMAEHATREAYRSLRDAAQRAFDSLPAPDAWNAPEIPRRIFDKLATGAPALAQSLMLQEKPVAVTG